MLFDGVLTAVGVLLLAVPYGLGVGAGGLLLSLALLVPLAWRRVRPVAVAAGVFAAAFGQWLSALAQPQLLLLPADVGVLVALYSVAAYGPRWASRTGLAVALLGAVLLPVGVAVQISAGRELESLAFLLLAVGGMVLAAWTSGDLRRIRRAQLTQLEERAARLEREREQEAQLVAAAERTRIARELHDVVAHSLSVVVAQADGGRYSAAACPAAARDALGTIAVTGRGALADMRRLLGVLRDGAPAATAPQPDLGAVPALLEGVRGSGLPVSLVQVGEPRPLPAAQGLAAFRIVQEGLTNVLRHAGPGTPTTVALHWGAEELVLQVDDEGVRTPATDGDGQGLCGVQERALLYGGSAHAGPRPGGGFRLRVGLPYA